MFRLNEKVVYPGHGVATISKVTEKMVGGEKINFYELTLLGKGTTILVPMESAHAIGLRSLTNLEGINRAFLVMSQSVKTSYHHEFSASSWNKRSKQYQSKLRNGGLVELSEVYRDLKLMQTKKELSFGEKELLHRTEELLAEEISLVQNNNEQNTIAKLRSLCKTTAYP
jgi:CarD family transcriptional regulator